MLTFFFGGFGLSTLWLLRLFWRIFKPLSRGGRPSLGGEGAIRFYSGGLLVLLASACLEGLVVNYYTDDPQVGGVVCRWLATSLGGTLGGPLTSLLMLAVLLAALPWYLGVSWQAAYARVTRGGEGVAGATLAISGALLGRLAGVRRRQRGAVRRADNGARRRPEATITKPRAEIRKPLAKRPPTVASNLSSSPAAAAATPPATSHRPSATPREQVIREPWLLPKSQRAAAPEAASSAGHPMPVASMVGAWRTAAAPVASTMLARGMTATPGKQADTSATPQHAMSSSASAIEPKRSEKRIEPAPIQTGTRPVVQPAVPITTVETGVIDPALVALAPGNPGVAAAPIPQAAPIQAAPVPGHAASGIPRLSLDALLTPTHWPDQLTAAAATNTQEDPAPSHASVQVDAPSEPAHDAALPARDESAPDGTEDVLDESAPDDEPHLLAEDKPDELLPPREPLAAWQSVTPSSSLRGHQLAANDDTGVARLSAPERIAPSAPMAPVRQRCSASLPPLSLLAAPPQATTSVDEIQLAETGELIEQRLREFKVPVTVVGASAGPVITRFEVEPAVGVRGNLVVALMKDLARGLGRTSIRVVETIPGKTCMGLELPNEQRQMIALSEILDSPEYRDSDSLLTLAMGKGITGEPVVADLAKAPHMLVAGTTGSGKSVAVNAMILSMLYKATPEEVRLIMIDPKMLELSVYEGIPHLLAPVVTDMKLAANALAWCVGEMENRYRLMSDLRVRNLAGFNQKVREAQAAGKPLWNPFPAHPEVPETLDTLPMIVVVIDELADLMMVVGKKIEELIARLAQKARAAGIHLILATQRPSVDVITGLIKANIPTRVAFQVSSKIDSRTILDQMGAESLLGQGDMLFMPPGTGYPQRIHGAFVGDEEVLRIVAYLKQFGEPDYIDDILAGPPGEAQGDLLEGGSGDAELDPLYDEAAAFVLRSRRASISFVQRQFRIGYNRAARLVEAMEAAGLVSSMGINGQREVIAPGPVD